MPFLKRNNRLVWDVSVRVVNVLHNEIWKEKETVSINNFADMAVQVKMRISHIYALIRGLGPLHLDYSIYHCDGRYKCLSPPYEISFQKRI